MYEIEKDKPMPKKRMGGTKYPFTEMEVGDSFDAPVKEGKSIELLRASILNSARRRTIQGWKFTTRCLPEEGVVRCKRIV